MLQKRPTILVISQVYVPDAAAVGQHFHDAAAALAARGYRVVVLTSARGYDNPSVRYPARETRDGVTIRRLPLSSFGKASIPVRIFAQSLFLAQALIRGLFVRRLSCVFVSTSPPLCSVAAMIIQFVRRVPLKYWVMDVNPDQVVQLGKFKESSIPVRLFNAFQRLMLRRSDDVIALDRFMKDRLTAKLDVPDKITVIPPWAHDDILEPIAHSDNPFRKQHSLDGKFVLMYSGNHTEANPLTSILQAAVEMQGRDNLVFAFIGGGTGKAEVRQTIADHNPANILDLPYQPLDQIRYSLSAADVHLVTVGDGVVGIVHPCKVYGAMAVARPILLVGPNPCHASDLIAKHDIGWHIPQSDPAAAIAVLDEILATPPKRLTEMGQRAKRVIETELSSARTIARVCDVITRGVRPAQLPNESTTSAAPSTRGAA